MKTKKLIVLALALSVIAASLAMPAAATNTTVHGVHVYYGGSHGTNSYSSQITGTIVEGEPYTVTNDLLATVSAKVYDSDGNYKYTNYNDGTLLASVSGSGLAFEVGFIYTTFTFDGVSLGSHLY